jgi:hypothetical protein
MDEDQKTTRSSDEALLREIRERYRYASDAWEDIRKERQKDLRYICGDPWEADDRKAREAAGRPVVNHDELNQYVNQAVNNLRQNKRGIKVEPGGNGADGNSAELRQDIIRTVEYRSKAQQAYLRAAQDMLEGSYGFFRIGRKYVIDDPADDDPHAFDQEITVGAIPNPDSVLYSPDVKEPDWSDAGWCFVVEPLATEEFLRQWPNAQKRDFTAEDLRVAKDWVSDKTVLVAEYWKVIVTERELNRGKKSRKKKSYRVVQYMTNGLEILDEIEHPGKEIPIPVVIGLERYLDEGSGPKRKLFSLCRLARDPQMSLAYLNSQETEEAGLSPKVPYIGYTGQFETDADAWEELNRVPRSFVQADPVTDSTGQQTLPLPQRQAFTPNFQEYEVAKDSCRRAIQAAMGIAPLPTAAQRNNEKSGIAIERIQTQEAIGSYHFTAGYERAIERAGRIADSWIKPIYDNKREMGLRKPDDSHKVVTINTAEPYLNQKGEQEHYPVGDGDHDVTVSAGPSYDSQREAVGEFLDTLIENLQTLPIPPPAAAKLLALAIQMKELGPKGDQMAEIISPSDTTQAQQLQGLQAQLQQQSAAMAEMQGQFQRLLVEKQGKVIDNEYALKLKEMDIQAKLAIAEIETKAQNVSERLAFVEEFIQQQHSQAHEAGMQAQDHAHERALAQQQQDAAAMSQGSDQAHQMGMAQIQQPQEGE